MIHNKELRQKMIAVKPATHNAIKDLQRELSYSLELNFSLDDILNMLIISGVDIAKVSSYNSDKTGFESEKDTLKEVVQ